MSKRAPPPTPPATTAPLNRRDLLLSSTAVGAAWLATRGTAHAQPTAPSSPVVPSPPVAPSPPPVARPGTAGGLTQVLPTPPSAQGLVTPNNGSLPFTVRGGVKVYHLIAEEVPHQIAPGLDIIGWGYNGRIHGPTIEAVEGDRVRIYVTNRLPEPTTVHWHGIDLPIGMDGVAGLTQPAIQPGETFRYEYTMPRAGTFMYHPHFDEMTQIALGMSGMLVVHPKGPRPARLRDYAIMLHEWQIPNGARRPNPLAMADFNVLTMNGKAFPATAPIVAEVGDRVRMRFGNLSPMDHHPIHMHGHAFRVVGTDGGAVPPAAQWPETTVLVPTGSVRVVEFVAERVGDWPMHCHMTHHVMNQMGHNVPNLIGADVAAADRAIRAQVPGYMTMGHDGMGHMSAMQMPLPQNGISMRGGRGPFGTIDMGGMFTLVKVRDTLAADPGFAVSPPETQARVAAAGELAADGIKP